MSREQVLVENRQIPQSLSKQLDKFKEIYNEFMYNHCMRHIVKVGKYGCYIEDNPAFLMALLYHALEIKKLDKLIELVQLFCQKNQQFAGEISSELSLVTENCKQNNELEQLAIAETYRLENVVCFAGAGQLLKLLLQCNKTETDKCITKPLAENSIDPMGVIFGIAMAKKHPSCLEVLLTEDYCPGQKILSKALLTLDDKYAETCKELIAKMCQKLQCINSQTSFVQLISNSSQPVSQGR
jgi:hypothetical protein